MRLIFFVVLLFTLIECLRAKRLEPLVPSEEYTHSLVVDEDKPEQFQLLWKLVNNNNEIQFEAHVKTTGWLGIGLSPNGGMVGSDIAIGWVKNNETFIKDCYADSKSAPKIDAIQNIDLIDGAEVNGYTILKFKRKLATCDEENDVEIKFGTQFMIFAWNDADPVTGNGDWKYHGQNRLPRTTMLLSFRNESINEQNLLPSDTYTFEMRIDNIKVPAKDTFYFCQVFKLPEFTEPTHLIQFEMLVNRANKHHIHHLLAYECLDEYPEDKPMYAQECGNREVPEYIGRYCLTKMIIAWGIGGQYNYSFPKQAGYRFKSSSKPRYILIEMHYDNPSLINTIVDDSGLKLYFTKQLRQHDLGLLQLGTDGNYISLQIPPKSNKISFESTCYPQCTEKFIPDDGIYAVGSLLHTHLAGRSVKTTLVRDGVAIKELFGNPNYDFNYQFILDIEPVKIQKGDALITECVYNTMDRNKFTFFGFSTYDEMCYDFMYYYPQIPEMDSCITIAPGEELLDFYNSLIAENLIPPFEFELEPYMIYYYGEEIMYFLNNNVTQSPQLTKRFEEFYGSPFNKSVYCGEPFGEFVYEHNKPHYTPTKYEIPESASCKDVTTEPTTTAELTTSTIEDTSTTTTTSVVPTTTAAAIQTNQETIPTTTSKNSAYINKSSKQPLALLAAILFLQFSL